MTTEAGRAKDAFDMIETSYLGHHGQGCCAWARHQLIAGLVAEESVGSALAAIPGRVLWAPTTWPAYWCDVDRTGDCGVHAVLASEVLDARGVPHDRGRAIVRVSPHVVAGWRASWDEANVASTWMSGAFAHHEILRIGDRWWDPTEARWFTGPGSALIAGRVVAVRTHDGDWTMEP